MGELNKKTEQNVLETEHFYDSLLKDREIGRRKFVRLLGKGATGRVYLIRVASENLPSMAKSFSPLEKEYAFKIFTDGSESEIFNRLERETRFVNEKNPNIAEIYEWGRISIPFNRSDNLLEPMLQVAFLQLEYCRGRNLKEYIAQRIRIDQRMTLRIMLEIGKAIKFCHHRNILHCDLKPANIMVDISRDTGDSEESCVVKVLDFGLSKPINYIQTSYGAGTLRYMAPEIFNLEKNTEKTDIYAFGLIIYEMLSGAGPFNYQPKSKFNTAFDFYQYHHCNQEPPSLHIFGNFSSALMSLIGSMLNKNPQQRPSAIDVVKQVREIMQEGKISTSPKLPLIKSVQSALSDEQQSIAPNGFAENNRFIVRPPNASDGNLSSTKKKFPLKNKELNTVNPLAADQQIPQPSARQPDSHIPPTPAPNSRKSQVVPFMYIVGCTLAIFVGAAFALIGWNFYYPIKIVQPDLGVLVDMSVTEPQARELYDAPGGAMVFITDPHMPPNMKPFLLDYTEVTRGAFSKCVEKGICENLRQSIKDNVLEEMQDRCTWNKSNFDRYALNPINCITAQQAEKFCAFVKKRLPEDREWHFAAFGPSPERFFTSPDLPTKSSKLCWAGSYETCRVDSEFTKEDISFFGVRGMAGNVSEWTSSFPGKSIYNKNSGHTDVRYIFGGSYTTLSAEKLLDLLKLNPETRLHRLLNYSAASQNTVGIRCAADGDLVQHLRKIRKL